MFEVDAPADNAEAEESYFVNFPYPYMNGTMHLGHCFAYATKFVFLKIFSFFFFFFFFFFGVAMTCWAPIA